MTEYWVYVIGIDGHFIRAVSLECVDDEAAIESAKKFVDGHDWELWQGERHVAKSDGKPK